MRIGTFKKYEGHFGSIEYSTDDNIYFGKILNIKGLVNYEAHTIDELRDEFHKAVDDYIIFCNEINVNNETDMHSTHLKKMIELDADGIDFVPFACDIRFAPVISSYTKDEFRNVTAIPKTYCRYWKMINGEKKIIT